MITGFLNPALGSVSWVLVPALSAFTISYLKTVIRGGTVRGKAREEGKETTAQDLRRLVWARAPVVNS